jgi:hypothetical protein
MIASITLTRHLQQESKVVYHDQVEIPMADQETNPGESVSFRIGLKVPEVYGKFSSAEIALELTGPAKLENFEEFANKYAARALAYQQELINQILVTSGKEPYFQHGQKEE